jgi:predicted dehydrogenase
MTADPIPVAVVGAGNMGANHVRVYDDLPGAQLVEIVEPDAVAKKDIAEEFDVEFLDDVNQIEMAEAATIAVPNRFHEQVTIDAIESGLDVLVEKPLALSSQDAQEIIDVAESNGSLLQVGHIERFNPMIEVLQKILEDEDIISIEAHRLGPFNEHLTEESVVFDLMIHDLDIIEYITNSQICNLSSIGSSPASQSLDHVISKFEVDSGVIGTVTASHVTHGKIRELTVTTRDAYISADYQQQDIFIQRIGTEETTTLVGDKSGYRTETVKESPYIQREEPLKREIEHFIDCVRNNTQPKITGKDGLKAVQNAEWVIEQVQ